MNFLPDVYKTWTGSWTTPNFQKEIAPVNMKIYRRSGWGMENTDLWFFINIP